MFVCHALLCVPPYFAAMVRVIYMPVKQVEKEQQSRLRLTIDPQSPPCVTVAESC